MHREEEVDVEWMQVRKKEERGTETAVRTDSIAFFEVSAKEDINVIESFQAAIVLGLIKKQRTRDAQAAHPIWVRNVLTRAANAEAIAAATATAANAAAMGRNKRGHIQWTPDNSTTGCEECGSRFTFMSRRHHCRRCGRLICAKCSPFTAVVLESGSHQPVRVCTPCPATGGHQLESMLQSQLDSMLPSLFFGFAPRPWSRENHRLCCTGAKRAIVAVLMASAYVDVVSGGSGGGGGASMNGEDCEGKGDDGESKAPDGVGKGDDGESHSSPRPCVPGLRRPRHPEGRLHLLTRYHVLVHVLSFLPAAAVPQWWFGEDWVAAKTERPERRCVAVEKPRNARCSLQ